ncbi:MAG: hypothetical protein ACYTEQ_28150 [Planctomycetota bacterium]|jgi:hypothetical protein
MIRRNFLKSLACLPFVGWFKPKPLTDAGVIEDLRLIDQDESFNKLCRLIRAAAAHHPSAVMSLEVAPHFDAHLTRSFGLFYAGDRRRFLDGVRCNVVSPRPVNDAYPWQVREGEDWRVIIHTSGPYKYITTFVGSNDDLEFS